MEKQKTERLKNIILLGFVMISVALIANIWLNALLDRESRAPGFYREGVQSDNEIHDTQVPSIDNGYYETQLANYDLGTSTPTREHKNKHLTPTPTTTATMIITVTPTPTEETDQ